MKQVVKTFVENVVQMYAAKAERGQVPAPDMTEFIDLLSGIDWSVQERTVPTTATVPGLRHLQDAIIAAYTHGPCPIVDTLRPCVGVKPWETYYADSDWSRPFLNEFASGELIGPNGFIPSSKISLGLFLLGPDTTYTEHAHDSTAVYYLLGGEAEWRVGGPDSVRKACPGDLIYTSPNQRHDIRTGATPMLAVFTWKADPAAPSYSLCRWSMARWHDHSATSGKSRMRPFLPWPGFKDNNDHNGFPSCHHMLFPHQQKGLRVYPAKLAPLISAPNLIKRLFKTPACLWVIASR